MTNTNWIQYGHYPYDIGAVDCPKMTHVDVASSLAKVNRFAGHTTVPYSVAQHSVHVAELLIGWDASPWLALCGLMHDVGETVIGDIPGPVKESLPEDARLRLEVFERNACRAIHKQLGVPWPVSPEARENIKVADLVALATERRDFLLNCSRDWHLPYEPDPQPLTAMVWSEAAVKWTNLYEMLAEECEVRHPLYGKLVAKELGENAVVT